MPEALTEEAIEDLAQLFAADIGVNEAARQTGHSLSTVSKYFAILRGRGMSREETNQRISDAKTK